MISSKHLDVYIREKFGLSEKDAKEIAASIIKKRPCPVKRIWDGFCVNGEIFRVPLKVVR